jgi:hypothetical protein
MKTCLAVSSTMQIALADFFGLLQSLHVKDPHLQFLKEQPFICLTKLIPQAIREACTIFTYSFACLGKAALVSEGQS